MRVQLSPWEIAKTSFRRPSPTRSRGTSAVVTPCPLIAASFVEQTSASLRSRKKRKTIKQDNLANVVGGEDRLPVLAITGPHRVAVLVEKSTSLGQKYTSQQLTDQEDVSRSGFEESSFLEFTSRPGKSTALIPDSAGEHDDKNGSSRPRIPAVFDAQRNRIYALQKQNARLICYSTTKGAATDVDSTLTVDLDTPALSLSLVHLPRTSSKTPPRCIVYGTCQDARLFVASLTSDKEPTLVVEYFETGLKSARDHVGTLACLVTLPDGHLGKRKETSDSSPGECELVIYQIVRQTKGVSIVQQRLHIAAYVIKGGTLASCLSTGFDKFALGKEVSLTKDECVSKVDALGFVDDQSAVAMFFTISDGRSYFTSILLRTGTAIGFPTLLSTSSRQVGLIGPSLLAVLTSTSVSVYDTIRGSRIHDVPLPRCLDKDSRVSLISDAKRSRLAIMFTQQDCYSVAFTTVRADNAATAQPLLCGSRLSLAASLASALSLRPKAFVRPTNNMRWNNKPIATAAPSFVERGVELLEEIFEKVQRKATVVARDSFFRDAFERALCQASGIDRIDAVRNGDNPQDAIPTEMKEKINGTYLPGKEKVDALTNGHQSPMQNLSQQLSEQPQCFIDSATCLIVDILCMPSLNEHGGTIRNDARFLLQQIVRSGRLSARTHFAPRSGNAMSFSGLLRSIELKPIEERHGIINHYTPMDFARQLCMHCSDVSEHQMVAIAHYVMSRAKPSDVAASFIRDKGLQEGDPMMDKITRFTALEAKRKRSAGEEADFSRIGRRLVLFSLAAMMQIFVEYSTCNDSLLRDALSNLLSDEELHFLAKFLVDVLYAPNRFCVNPGPGLLRNAIQWLSAVCDCQKQMSPSGPELKHIRRSVATQLWVTGKIVTLQCAFNDMLAGSSGRRRAGEPSAPDEKSSRNLPPYQIERLAF